jgi:hypothetical protein
MLNSAEPIPLGNNGIRGMIIQIELSPDANVISNSNRGRPTDATLNNGAFYQLRDLSLTFESLIPDDVGKGKMAIPSTGQFAYNSVANLYSVANTSDMTQSFNLGTTNTLSVFHNFIPTTHLNNYLHDSMKTPGLQNYNTANTDYAGPDVRIDEVHFTKGGVKFPLDYELIESVPSTGRLPMASIEQNFMNAIKPIGEYNHSLKSLWTSANLVSKENINGNPVPAASSPGVYQNTLDVGGAAVVVNNKVFGIGVNFDPVSRVGVNFKNTPYSLRIKSALNGNSPNSVYTYTLSRNVVSYSPSGIMVQT